VWHDGDAQRLVAGCGVGGGNRARVDVISTSGERVGSIVTTDVGNPSYLAIHNENMYMTETCRDGVLMMSLSTGRAGQIITHPELHDARQVCATAGSRGTFLVASHEGNCVLGVSAGGGEGGSRACAVDL
jgi:hypothetical protein